METLQKEEAVVLDVVISDQIKQLVVFNDDFNTFDFVIETLIDICHHSPEQAEQCTWIIHHKGKCKVKSGAFNVIKPMRNAICDRGISAEIL